ncbi:MAG TPA: hypothetical protein VE861_10855, partial [Gemmatimonadaceae bacterium]|nr:hypothetical protein [Gemmatimonadaceae bacterium]
EFENLLPTGRLLPVSDVRLDFRVPRTIGATRLNHCFAKPVRASDGRVVMRLSNADRAVTVWMDAAFDHLVVYTGDALPEGVARRSIAIEPMSCATDALNHAGWGLRRLAPGETLRGSWGVSTDH